MKQVVEIYISIWGLMLLLMIGIAFTSINMNVIQARRIYNNIRAEIQASNGALVDATGNLIKTTADTGYTIENDGFCYAYTVTRQNAVDSTIKEDDETFRYNNIYKISIVYEYNVPLFGRQIYPISGYAN